MRICVALALCHVHVTFAAKNVQTKHWNGSSSTKPRQAAKYPFIYNGHDNALISEFSPNFFSKKPGLLTMDGVLGVFREAYAEESGYKLAESLTPVAPADDAGLLYGFYRSTNPYDLQADLRNAIVYKSDIRIAKPEANAWIDLYTAYWKAVGELLAIEEALNQGKNGDWKKVYDIWKEVLNALLRGYQSQAFAAWTIPCLYVAGKYLRNFAIKADEQDNSSDSSMNFNGGFQDEIAGTLGKNECLQDAARQVNRIFSVCISDRYESIEHFEMSQMPC